MGENFVIRYDYTPGSGGTPSDAQFRVVNSGLTSGLFTTTLDIVISNFVGTGTRSESRNVFQSGSFSHSIQLSPSEVPKC